MKLSNVFKYVLILFILVKCGSPIFANIQNQISLKIKENRVGFNTAEIKNSKGIGCQNIYSRVSMLNGNIEVKSSSENGTLVEIDFNA